MDDLDSAKEEGELSEYAFDFECYGFFVVTEKLRCADVETSDLQHIDIIVRHKSMYEWFTKRVGQTEVVRNGHIVEPLYFTMPVCGRVVSNVCNMHILYHFWKVRRNPPNDSLGVQKEYLDPVRRHETKEAIMDVIMEAPLTDSEAKLEFFLEGADAIVHHLLTMQNRIESGRVDRLLVWLRAKFGTVGQTKKLSHPIVLITLVINVCLVLGYDNDAIPCGNALVGAGGSRSTEDMESPLIDLCLPGLKTFSVRALGDHSHAHPCAKSPPRPQVNTYSRWPPAFYILLGLPPTPLHCSGPAPVLSHDCATIMR